MPQKPKSPATAPGHGRGRAPWNKGKLLPPEPLTDDEARALIRAASGRAPTGIRNAALLSVLWGAGLRCSEALALALKDFDPKQGTLRVREGKARPDGKRKKRQRTAALAPECIPYLERWTEKRRELGLNGKGKSLFCTLDSKPLLSSYVRQMTRRMGERAGLEKRAHPHGLRHSHAAKLANAGVPVHVLQAQLGHANLATTDVYLRHLSPQVTADLIREAWKDD